MRRRWLALALLLGLPLTAEAAPLTLYTFSGTLTSVSLRNVPPELAGVGVGDPFSGFFYYIVTEPPIDQSGGGASAIFTNVAVVYSVSFNGVSLSAGQPYLELNPSQNWFRVGDTQPRPSSPFTNAGESPFFIDDLWVFLASSQTIFPDRSLPLWLDVAAFDGWSNLQIVGLREGGDSLFDVVGTIDSLQSHPVPQPATLLLCGLGVVLLALGRRIQGRRRARPSSN